MKHRNNHFAVGYWALIRRGRPAPDQADIDPKALKRLLPFVFLLDARQGSFVYRLAGTTLCERYGGELRGQDFLAKWDRESRTKLPALLRDSLNESVPLCLTSVGTTEDHRMTEIETVLMPITYKGEQRERFIGVTQLLTDVSPLDRAIAYESLVLSKLIREGQCEVPPTTIVSAPRSAPRAKAVRRSRTSRGAHLKLVVSQPQPASGHNETRFDGNGALATLMECHSPKAKDGRA
jgi:hypothetical protein